MTGKGEEIGGQRGPCKTDTVRSIQVTGSPAVMRHDVPQRTTASAPSIGPRRIRLTQMA